MIPLLILQNHQKRGVKSTSESEEEEEKTQNSNASNYTLENGTYVYTNEVGEKLAWNQSTNAWEARQEVAPNYVFDGDTYFYKDTAGKYLRFSKVENKWDETSSEIYHAAVEMQKNIPQPTPTGNTQVQPDETGSYEWDPEKGAWFPKVCFIPNFYLLFEEEPVKIIHLCTGTSGDWRIRLLLFQGGMGGGCWV